MDSFEKRGGDSIERMQKPQLLDVVIQTEPSTAALTKIRGTDGVTYLVIFRFPKTIGSVESIEIPRLVQKIEEEGGEVKEIPIPIPPAFLERVRQIIFEKHIQNI